MERKGIHPNILAAMIGAAATLLAAVITVAVTTRGKESPAESPPVSAQSEVPDAGTPPPAQLKPSYHYREERNWVRLSFSLQRGSWTLSAQQDDQRWSAGGTYRVAGDSVTLVVASGSPRPPGFESIVMLRVGREGILEVTSPGAPKWKIPPV
jgi:hypothetical protein